MCCGRNGLDLLQGSITCAEVGGSEDVQGRRFSRKQKGSIEVHSFLLLLDAVSRLVVVGIGLKFFPI